MCADCGNVCLVDWSLKGLNDRTGIGGTSIHMGYLEIDFSNGALPKPAGTNARDVFRSFFLVRPHPKRPGRLLELFFPGDRRRKIRGAGQEDRGGQRMGHSWQKPAVVGFLCFFAGATLLEIPGWGSFQ